MADTTYTVIFQLALLLVAIAVLSKRFQSSNKLPLPPGPPRDPIIGSLRHFPANEFPRVFSEWKYTYGDIVYTNVFGMSTVILNSRKAIEDLMVDRAHKYQYRSVIYMLGRMCGWDWNTALKQAGPDHSYERRLLLSGLGPSAIKQWHSIIENVTQDLVRQLNESKGNNISKTLKHHVGTVVLRIAYGKGIFDAHGEELIQFNTEAVQLSNWILSKFWMVDVFPALQYLPKWMPLNFLRIAEECREAATRIRDWPLKMVLDELKGQTVHPSFARKSLEDNHVHERVRDAVGIFFAAGLDTTFIAFSTFVLAMTLYPKVQSTAQSEIDAFIKAEDRLPTFDDRTRLPYYEFIIKEVFRWNPPIPLVIPHTNLEEDEYSGYRIPKNSTIFPNVWQLTHDKEIWKDPEEFRPERFAEPDSQNLPDPTQLVFGFGKRLCPGKHLGDRTLYLAIVHILALFTIELAPGEERPTKLFDTGFFSFPILPPVKLSLRNQSLLPLA